MTVSATCNYSENTPYSLGKQWHEAAEKNFDSKERLNLCEATNFQVNQLKEEIDCKGTTERIIAICDSCIQDFNERSVGERELLAMWTGRNSGMYHSLHGLFELIVKVKNWPDIFNPLDEIDNWSPLTPYANIDYLDGSALEYIKRMKVNIDNSEIRKILASYLDAKTKRVLNCVNRSSQNETTQDQINGINCGRISLESLGIRSRGIQAMHDLVGYFGKENCLKITRLDLSECGEVSEFLIDEAVKYFPNTVHLSLKNSLLCDQSAKLLIKFKRIKSINLSSCEAITTADFLKGFSFLEEVNFNACIRLANISAFQVCKQLKKIDLGKCWEIDDFTDLQFCNDLEYLNVERCSWISVSEALPLCPATLKSLNLSRCPGVSDLNILEECKFAANLTTLNLEGCSISSIAFLQYCRYLLRINLKGCTKLSDIDDFKHCIFLEEVDISEIGNSEEKSGLKNIEVLGLCRYLKRLNMGFSRNITSIEALANCNLLEYLNMEYCQCVESVSALQDCKNLSELNLKMCIDLHDINVLAPCRLMRVLNLFSCHSLKDMSVLKYFSLLEDLDISECYSMESVEEIGSCPRLRHLRMKGCYKLNQPQFWENCPLIEYLDLSQCGFGSIEFLKYLGELKDLDLTSCYGVQDFTPIKKCNSLNQLRLDNTLVSELDFVPFLPHLKFLYMKGCNLVEDFSILSKCPQIKIIDLFKCQHVTLEVIRAIISTEAVVVSDAL